MTWESCLPVSQEWSALFTEDIVSFCKAWRNRELASTDWTQLPDVDLANKWDWATYRQALRDLPQQGPDPKLWVFPVPPT